VLQSLGLIHGDLKPKNILLDDESNAVIADFGTLKAQHSTVTVVTGKELVFTPIYSPPELLNFKEKNKGTDVWSFGCLALKLFTGENPYNAVDKRQIINHISSESETVYEHYKKNKGKTDFEINQCVLELIVGCTQMRFQERLNIIEIN